MTGRPERTAAQREHRYWWLLACFFVAVCVGAMLITLAVQDYPLVSPLTLVLLGVCLVMFALVIGVVVLLRRTKLRMFQRSVLWEADRPDRKLVLRAIRRGEPVPDRLRDLAHRVAGQIAGRRNLTWLYGLLLVVWVFLGVQQSDYLRWLDFSVAALYLVLVGYLVWFQRRARSFQQRFSFQEPR